MLVLPDRATSVTPGVVMSLSVQLVYPYQPCRWPNAQQSTYMHFRFCIKVLHKISRLWRRAKAEALAGDLSTLEGPECSPILFLGFLYKCVLSCNPEPYFKYQGPDIVRSDCAGSTNTTIQGLLTSCSLIVKPKVEP